MNDFTISISLEDLAVYVTVAQILAVATRWFIRWLVTYTYEIIRDLEQHRDDG